MSRKPGKPRSKGYRRARWVVEPDPPVWVDGQPRARRKLDGPACSRCGYVNEARQRFCDRCDAPLPQLGHP